MKGFQRKYCVPTRATLQISEIGVNFEIQKIWQNIILYMEIVCSAISVFLLAFEIERFMIF